MQLRDTRQELGRETEVGQTPRERHGRERLRRQKPEVDARETPETDLSERPETDAGERELKQGQGRKNRNRRRGERSKRDLDEEDLRQT